MKDTVHESTLSTTVFCELCSLVGHVSVVLGGRGNYEIFLDVLFKDVRVLIGSEISQTIPVP